MLKYEVVNNNKDEWVVFVHGIGGSTKTWKKQIEPFSEKFNLLLLDLPGHGDNASNIIKKVDLDKLYKGIKDTLDYLKIKAAHFVGMSLGTLVIAEFVTLYPSYAIDIILGGAILEVSGIYRECMMLANAMKNCVPYKLLYNFFTWFMMPRENHKKSRLIFLREVVKLDKATMKAYIEYLQRALKTRETVEKIDALGKRVLLISGNEDHCFLKGTEKFFNKLHNGKMIILEKCGHVCTIEKHREFNKLALDFIS